MGMTRGRSPSLLATATLATALLAACRSPIITSGTGTSRTGTPETAVTVLAAASLTAAFEELAGRFEQATPGATVELSFGGSSQLATQIIEGAPVDVFASADGESMQRVADAGALGGPAEVFARNGLQIVVSPGNPLGITGLADLTAPGLRLALCAPEVPCGRYATEAFGKASLILPDASQEDSVTGVLTKVSLGEADVGIAYVTDVLEAGGRVEGVVIPPDHNVVAEYFLAVLAEAKHRPAAEAFRKFCFSPLGREVLARHGFG